MHATKRSNKSSRVLGRTPSASRRGSPNFRDNISRVTQKEIISTTSSGSVLANRPIVFATFTDVMAKYDGIYANGRLTSLRMRPALQVTPSIVIYGFTAGLTVPTTIGVVNNCQTSNLATSRPWTVFDTSLLDKKRYLLAGSVLGQFNYVSSVALNWEVEWTASFDSVDI